MMQSLVFNEFGASDVLFMRNHPTPQPGAGELLVDVSAAGLNFADIYRRQGRYPLAGNAPWVAGYEGAGQVIAVGSGVNGWQPGDRVGFADVPLAHASHIVVAQEHAIRLPDWLSEAQAASILLQGLTADYLVHDVLPVVPGMRVAVLAAAGGVGSLLTQMLVHRGVLVFAVASNQIKQHRCLRNGADAAADYDSWPEQVRAWHTAGCDIVFDSVGSTLLQSLESLKDGGRVVLFGMSGGTIPTPDPAQFLLRSTGIIGADLWTYLTSQQERQRRADRLFALLKEGHIKLPEVTSFPLYRGKEAHDLLENRGFSGKVILIP
ncbi:alcohol dehydrogenase [Kosakonia sacchari]|uniref:NADPH:quinone reductase n=1 Tax=Kosakonia sacchari TaxID=1158459 RepID=A0A1G4YUB4_9ENTR|nr:quinone oxidoreductase [Kosakonia sacchari]AIA25177.2 alcohol dehydrogenase [Kosakonia sacchari SP1]ANR79876.1 alcohol dehydrogenase [Kosakonia sacchari]MDN2487391.1 quinone oxidoreductase [Kosakonia sacchari]SCX57000.1 NADPH:quinone reductase [Kosakonia sacchari]